MGRFGTAFRLFFRALGDDAFAARGAALLQGKLPAAEKPAEPTKAPAPAPPKPARSEALTLLSLLQREGRLVDFLKEDISAYADAQIGAAVRDIHRDCAAALERVFSLRPLRTEAEGASIEVPASFDAAQVRLVGNVAGQGPYRGALRHPGWSATRVDLPAWTGSASSAATIAPAEVEV